MRGLSRVFSFAASIPTGRFTKFLVIAIWIVVLATLGHNSVNLTKAQKSDPADTLPGNAESRLALQESARFPAGRLTPGAVIYRRAGGLTSADLAKVYSDSIQLSSVKGVGGVDKPQYSRDHTSALVIVRVNPARGGVINSVKAIRKVVGHGGGGLAVEVTGSAAFIADAASVFSGVDATLLFATLGLVFVLLIAIYRSPIFWILPLFSIIVAVGASRGLAYVLGKNGVTITGEAGGILTVLVFGVGTDYSLLLVARYREELERRESSQSRPSPKRCAARRLRSCRRASPSSPGSSACCWLTSKEPKDSARSALSASPWPCCRCSPFFPHCLRSLGGALSGPSSPARGMTAMSSEVESGGVSRSAWPRPLDASGLPPCSVLAVLAIGLVDLNSSLTSENGFINTPDAVKGQTLVAKAFPPGLSAPGYVVTTNVSRVAAVQAALQQDPLLASVAAVQQSHGAARFELSLQHDPYNEVGFNDIQSVRRAGSIGGWHDDARWGPDGAGARLADRASRGTTW